MNTIKNHIQIKLTMENMIRFIMRMLIKTIISTCLLSFTPGNIVIARTTDISAINNYESVPEDLISDGDTNEKSDHNYSIDTYYTRESYVINGNTREERILMKRLMDGENDFELNEDINPVDFYNLISNNPYSSLGFKYYLTFTHNSRYTSVGVIRRLIKVDEGNIVHCDYEYDLGELGERKQLLKNTVDKYIEENITEDMSDFEKMKSLYYAVMQGSQYSNDMGKYNVFSALIDKNSSCAPTNAALNLLYNKAGIKCCTITTRVHQFSAINIDGDWFWTDATPLNPADCFIMKVNKGSDFRHVMKQNHLKNIYPQWEV